MLETLFGKNYETHLAPSVPARNKITNPLILSNKCDPLSYPIDSDSIGLN